MEVQELKGRLLGVKEVAALLGVPVSWVYGHVADGSLPHLKIGRYVRFHPRAIAAWIQASTRG